jgi:hypothetical protein
VIAGVANVVTIQAGGRKVRTMTNITQPLRLALAAAVGVASLFVSPANWSSSPENASLISQAEARIGRPATPGSIAGVNRRVHRRVARGAYYGAAAGAIGAAGVYSASRYYGSYADPYNSYAYGSSEAVDQGSAACAARYRSYDVSTGTYLGNDGLRHPCP